MERFAQRESVLLGYSPQRSFDISMRKSDTSSDMDFSDVFGGPPRRYSIQENRTRYSFSEAGMDSEAEEDAAVVPQSPWSVAEEKPVFGGESVSRRTYPSDDFFDDIFKGDESKSFNSPSRRSSRDLFGSNPGFTVLSPSRPLPPKAEPFSASFPAQFSLPPKVTKATDSPLFGSPNRGPYNNKDGIANGMSNGHTSNASPSRFSSQATELKDQTRNDRPLYRQSPLSQEVRNSSQESSYETKSEEKDIDTKMKKSESKEVPLNSGQFHFSIYKWAGSGIPLLMPLGGSKSRFRDRFRTDRCSSSNGRIESDSISRHLPTVEENCTSLNKELSSLKVNNGNHDDSSKEKKIESGSDIEETHLKIPEPKFFSSEGHDITQGGTISKKNTEVESHSKHETSEKEAYVYKGQTPKTEPKPLYDLLNDEDQEQGNAAQGKENKVKDTNIANNDDNVNTRANKSDSKRINSYKSEVTNVSLQNSETNSGDAFGRSRVKGKVKEFVKIFNHESSEKIKNDFGSQSTRWKQVNIHGKQNGVSNAVKTDEKVKENGASNAVKTNEKVKENGVSNAVKTDEKLHSLNKNKMSESSSKEDDTFNKNKVKQESHSKSSVHKTSGLFTREKNASLFSDSLPNNYDNKVENRDEPLHGFFVVEELSYVEEKVLQTCGESEHIQASNAKIQQWSNGRKGNIRSLLSTMQFVLWPESGWKPVPLVDLIEGSAVKRAYQRALLYLHPDKLQQKGAASHQKYIAEQVFDILQEAWDHFNSLGAI